MTVLETWVCDGCMMRVIRSQIAVWADGEHVLCWWCDRDYRDHAAALAEVKRKAAAGIRRVVLSLCDEAERIAGTWETHVTTSVLRAAVGSPPRESAGRRKPRDHPPGTNLHQNRIPSDDQLQRGEPEATP